MTSLQHDDGIEIITFNGDSSGAHNHTHSHHGSQKKHSQTGYYNIGSPTESTNSHQSCPRPPGYYHLSSVSSPASESKNTYFSVENGDHVCVLPNNSEPPTEKQKRIARVVMVLAGFLLVMSILLVGITLTMSDHIDDMDANKSESPGIELSQTEGLDEVRKANGLLTTQPTPQGNRATGSTHQTNSTTR